MGTTEIIIVFSALMALVALVAIGIDWVGKPLKHRRFIPRMYRFEDEKLPIDAYGHTDFSAPSPATITPQPEPVVVARVPQHVMVEAPTAATASGWRPGMALDLTEDDRKPNLATKALRFWKTTATALSDSHFDADDMARMHEGKAPRRKNPRTGRYENMQLTGLRQASQADQVHMRWPDEATDPWLGS